MKCNYNFIYTRDSLWGKSNIKFKRSMKLLLKDMEGLKRDSHNLKEASYMGTKCKKDLTRAPMYRKAIPFT